MSTIGSTLYSSGRNFINKLEVNQKAKGILLDELENKIVQLADDTTIFTKDLDSLQAFIADFKHFESISGLKLNLDKSEIIPLGPLRQTEFVIPTKINMLKVNKKAFKTWESGFPVIRTNAKS